MLSDLHMHTDTHESTQAHTPMHTATSTLAWTDACACAHATLHARREKREDAAEAHARFRSREGDHLTLLAVFRAYTGVTRKGGERAAWCRSHFVNPRAMRKALDIHTQVAERPLPAARICMLLDLCVVVLRCPGGCARCSLATGCVLLACLHQPLRPCCCGLQLKEHLQALGIPQRSCGEDSLPLRRALVAGLFPHAAKRQLDGGSGEGRRSSAGCFNGCCRRASRRVLLQLHGSFTANPDNTPSPCRELQGDCHWAGRGDTPLLRAGWQEAGVHRLQRAGELAWKAAFRWLPGCTTCGWGEMLLVTVLDFSRLLSAEGSGDGYGRIAVRVCITCDQPAHLPLPGPALSRYVRQSSTPAMRQ